MMSATDTASSSPGHNPQFKATHWSVVVRAGDDDFEVRAAALGKLYCAYWYPIYSFIRWRRRCGHHEAEDLTQAFFVHLVEAETLKRADREKGRFRTFLLGALEKFLINDWKWQQRIKRGGQCQTISIDEAVAEGRYGCEPADSDTPDKAFDRPWAATLLGRVLDRLRKEYVETGTIELFEELKSTLSGKAATGSYAETAAKLGKSEAAVRVAVHRLRAEFRRVLREEVAQTVCTAEDVDDEIRHLMSATSV
jgi:RNA polymerase sigma-70 factor (ECF subfamily)